MSEWSEARLSDVAEIRFSNVDKRTIPGEVLVRLCNYMDVYGNAGYVTSDLAFMEASASTIEIERFRVERGDVLLTKDSETPDDIGIPAVVIDDIPNLICGYHLALVKPRRGQIDSAYLAKQLGSQPTARYFSRLPMARHVTACPHPQLLARPFHSRRFRSNAASPKSFRRWTRRLSRRNR
jgi:type I restriction enzyme, S subunit